MDGPRMGLSVEDIHDELVAQLNRDPDLMRLLDDARLERIIECLCEGIARVMDHNNQALRDALEAGLMRLDARLRRL